MFYSVVFQLVHATNDFFLKVSPFSVGYVDPKQISGNVGKSDFLLQTPLHLGSPEASPSVETIETGVDTDFL